MRDKANEKKMKEVRAKEARDFHLTKWVPKTRAGKLVQRGEVTTLEQLYEMNLPILESEIVDVLIPNLEEDVLQVKNCSRTTDAGRKRSSFVCAVVGDKNGHVGVGIGRGLNVKPAIESAMRAAKLNIISIAKGCGSWECSCGTGHSTPYKSEGKNGSVRMMLIPAPKGTGIVAGANAKRVIELAGIKDVWTQTKGDSRTIFNAAMATLDALQNIRRKKYRVSTRADSQPAGEAA